MSYIAIDIGGTSVKSALIDDGGVILQKSKTPTFSEGKSVLETVISAVSKLFSDEVAGIGICTAGIVNTNTGTVEGAVENIAELEGVCLKGELEKAFSVDVIVKNDVNSFAIGEAYLRGGLKNCFVVALGTGIGGALVIGGKVIGGANNACGEIGYLGCYSGASFEDESSTLVFEKELRDKFGLSTEEAFERARGGDERINKAIDAWVKRIAEQLSAIVFITDIGTIIIGGGVSAQGEFLREKFDNALREVLPLAFRKNTKVEFVTKSNDTALLGAVYEFIKK